MDLQATAKEIQAAIAKLKEERAVVVEKIERVTAALEALEDNRTSKPPLRKRAPQRKRGPGRPSSTWTPEMRKAHGRRVAAALKKKREEQTKVED